MDPSEFGYSELEMKHAPYGPITSEALRDANAGKVAVVTGAAQGIGAAIAEALAKSGASVALLDLFAERLAKTKQACEQHGVGVRAYTCDVTDGDRVREILDAVEMELGHIDVLVNNAGILDQRPFIMADFDAFWRQVEVNFKALQLLFLVLRILVTVQPHVWVDYTADRAQPLVAIHAMLPRFRDRGAGCIINIASRSATVDVPMTLGYVTSKAALARATHTLQREMVLDKLDPAVHLYALHPGGVLTGMGGAGASQDVRDKYGDVRDEEFFKDLFKDEPELCGQTCAWLATGKGKALRGLYLDCRQDVERLLGVGRAVLLKEKKNVLTVNFVEGYANEP